MKKLVSIFLVTVLLLTCFATVVSADEPVTVSGENKTTDAGAEVTIAFSVNEATYAGYGYIVTCDEGLTILSISRGDASADDEENGVYGSFIANKANGKVGAAFSENVTRSGVLFKVKVKVSEDAVPGMTYNINIEKAYGMVAADGTVVNESVAGGSVTIEEKSTEEPTTEPVTEEPTTEPTTEEPTEAPTQKPTETPTQKPTEGEKDDVPETGDISTQVYMTGALVLVLMAAAVALVTKRRSVK